MERQQTTYKASHLLVRDLPEELRNTYEAAHRLAARLAELFMAMLQEPYTRRRAGGTEEQVTKEDIECQLEQLCGKLTKGKRELLYAFANSVLPVKDGPGSDDRSFRFPENCYPVVFFKETDSGTRYFKRKAYQTLKSAVAEKWSWKDLKTEIGKPQYAEEYGLFSEDEWKSHWKSKSLEIFGKELLARTPREGMNAALRLRKLGVFPLDRCGLDDEILCAVMAATTDRLRSWRACHQRTVERKTQLRERFEEAIKKLSSREYELFLEYAEELEGRQYAVTKKVLLGLSDALRSGKPGTFKLAYEVLCQDKYLPIHKEFRALGFAYLAEQRFQHTPNGAKITFFDSAHSPLLLSFGMTGRGYRFTLSTDKNSLLFVIRAKHGDIGFSCVPSRYFWHPKVAPVKDGFELDFVRMGGGNPRIKGVVKEPALMRVKDRYYVNMRVNVPVKSVDDEVRTGKRYFSSSLLEKKLEAPERKLRVMGLDLGLNPAAAYAVVDLRRKPDRICCPASNLSPGCFETSGTIGNVVSRRLHSELVDLAKQCYYGPKYIYLSKKLRDGKQLNEVELAVLNTFIAGFQITHVEDPWRRKDLIGQRVSEIAKKYRQLSAELAVRDVPDHRAKKWEMVPAETFQMLRVLQNIRSLLKAWARYSWTKEKTGKLPENELNAYNERYRNLRLDTLKKLVHCIVKKAKELDVDIVVAEDLEVVDYDDEIKGRKENSLRALWSPNMVLESLERSLLEQGVEMVRVDPRHTSQISSLTEEFGFRSPLAKERFYFTDEGTVWRINADINAAMNIARRFLTRYRTFTSLRGWSLEDGSYLVPASDSKRLTAFLKLETGKTFVRLVPDGDGFRLEGMSKGKYDKLAQQVPASARRLKFYRHDAGWLILEQHIAKRQELKSQVSALGDRKIKEIQV